MDKILIVCCLVAVSAVALVQWLAQKTHRRTNWTVGGISLGDSRSKVLRLKGPPAAVRGKGKIGEADTLVYLPYEDGVWFVSFDKNDRVTFLWGFILDGPNGTFLTKTSVQEVLEKMGVPDTQNDRSLLYFRSDQTIQFDHSDGIVEAVFLRHYRQGDENSLNSLPQFPVPKQ